MIGLSRGLSVFAFTEAVDMRKSFNTLSALVADQMKREVLTGDLFLFVSNDRKRGAWCLLPNMTVMITRRTLRRTHLFRPDTEVSQLYAYCLAVAAQRHGILVHAVLLMSTHEHLVVTDPRPTVSVSRGREP